MCEVVPQHTRLILHKPHVRSDVGCIVLYKRSAATASFPRYIEHAPVLNKSGEAPVTFFFGETVVSGMVHI
jgi:hypothetical protein